MAKVADTTWCDGCKRRIRGWKITASQTGVRDSHYCSEGCYAKRHPESARWTRLALKTFEVHGVDRAVGALGVHEEFVERVQVGGIRPPETEAQAAIEMARHVRYAKGREHVHIHPEFGAREVTS